ncbi:uncharacterized protein ANIA_10500 [Aspergillus nidulans FGSC A4]|uniref:Uncharacterized protein n=1 Tax=Emericella nidulans (strain FGSC A4 / ATCC 38163 / CBS 112.46 / NRRL 194 / M139) TaxID=227321 RepID=C8V5Y6_EMENI|nr:hypothetical protein [Aspergillus nidulans FGSC A4]CBF74998.1 TPA: hypothetical protein ANIA_10500 [Aspergillus nidulans FGSC A4]
MCSYHNDDRTNPCHDNRQSGYAKCMVDAIAIAFASSHFAAYILRMPQSTWSCRDFLGVDDWSSLSEVDYQRGWNQRLPGGRRRLAAAVSLPGISISSAGVTDPWSLEFREKFARSRRSTCTAATIGISI